MSASPARENSKRKRRISGRLKQQPVACQRTPRWLCKRFAAMLGLTTAPSLRTPKPISADAKCFRPKATQNSVKQMERRWRGIMANPDAVEGKKQKSKFKDRQRDLAKRLLQLNAARTQAGFACLGAI